MRSKQSKKYSISKPLNIKRRWRNLKTHAGLERKINQPAGNHCNGKMHHVHGYMAGWVWLGWFKDAKLKH